MSLKEGFKRPAINFHIELDDSLDVVDFSISERKIKSLAKLTYENVVDILTDQTNHSEIKKMLLNAYELAIKLSNKRKQMGALSYFDPDKGLYTDEEGNVKIFANKKVAIAYMIIQEMMVLTNSETARYFAEKDIPFVYRNHTVKSNIPDREEVHNQLLTAINNPSTLSTFISRMSIWQNRAIYETKLKGHYALNLPAYAHVTSPIRRFPDLLNHTIIRSHITGSPIPFTIEQIEDYCNFVNDFFEKEREKKTEHFKKIFNQEISASLININSNALSEMEVRDFKNILKNLRSSAAIKPIIKTEILNRLNSMSITAIEIYYIIFESDWLESEPDIRDAILDNILKIPSIGSQILYLMQSQNLISEIEEETEKKGDIFHNRTYIKTSDNKYYTTTLKISNTNKKEAINSSRAAVLVDFIKNNCIEAEKPTTNYIETEENTQHKDQTIEHSNIQESTIEDSVSLINTLTMQNNDIKLLGYYIEPLPENNTSFKCKLELKYKEEVLEFYGNGKNKKTAKQKAAKMAFLHLQDFAVSKVDNRLDAIRKLIEEGLQSNAISLICQYFDTRMPIYTFKEISSVPEPEFECTAEIIIKDFTASVTQTGNSKKTAKNNAVDLLIGKIRTYFKDFEE